MVVKFTEVVQKSGLNTNLSGEASPYILRDVLINPDHVVCVRENVNFKQLLKESKLPEGLDASHEFCSMAVQHGHSGMNIVVVGSSSTVQSKLKGKELLNG